MIMCGALRGPKHLFFYHLFLARALGFFLRKKAPFHMGILQEGRTGHG